MVADDSVYIYASAPENYNRVSCQIGTEEAEEITSEKVANIENAMETYILIDNSLSITSEYRDKVKEIAQAVISARSSNECMTVATFDTELHVLTDKSTDTNALTEIVKQIEYKNLDTKLTDVLYQLYQSFEKNDFNGVRRVIVISDGAEYQKVGYTKEEVLSKVRDYDYPIYTLGCKYKNNETELENMFRFSRETGGIYWMLDDIQDISSVVNQMSEMKNTVLIKAKIPEKMGDGSEKGIKITFYSENGNEEISLKETMPFIVEKETETLTEKITEQETLPETQTEELTEFESQTEIITQESGMDKYVIVLLIGAVALVGIVVVFIIFKKKKSEDGDEEEFIDDLFSGSSEIQTNGETEILGNDETEILNDDWTVCADQYRVRLTDVNNPTVMREFSVENEVRIGRKAAKADIVFEYERTVSSLHCALMAKNGDIYIKDMNSANGTVVDGTRIAEETILYSGSILKLGNLQLKFELL